MALCIRKGAAFVALFSTLAIADELPPSAVLPEFLARPSTSIYQLPVWVESIEIRLPIFIRDEPSLPELPKSTMGKIKNNESSKYFCFRNGEWKLCDC